MDIDREFRLFSGSVAETASTTSSEEPLTLERLKEVMRTLGPPLPPPPAIKLSKHATMLPEVEPNTDDMREMVERVGKQRVPACFKITSPFGNMFVVHPNLITTPDTEEG